MWLLLGPLRIPTCSPGLGTTRQPSPECPPASEAAPCLVSARLRSLGNESSQSLAGAQTGLPSGSLAVQLFTALVEELLAMPGLRALPLFKTTSL